MHLKARISEFLGLHESRSYRRRKLEREVMAIGGVYTVIVDACCSAKWAAPKLPEFSRFTLHLQNRKPEAGYRAALPCLFGAE